MHMHATSCDGTFQKAIVRKVIFMGQLRYDTVLGADGP